MMIAVVISMTLMLLASKPLTAFVNARPTVIMLCLGFLMMIGFSLTAEGLGYHIPKGYLYAAIGFSIAIEFFNQLARSRRKRSLQGTRPLRERTAHAVLRLLGGKLAADEVDDEIADLIEPGGDGGTPFNRRERVMISGVLSLAEQSIRTVMTDRMQVDRFSLDDSAERVHQALLNSPHSRLVVFRDATPDEPLGYVHKKELLRGLLDGQLPQIEPLVRTPINLPESCTVLSALEQMRQASTHVAFIVNEFGGFEGLVTLTDILEAIAGELPDASEMDGPDIEPVEGGYRVNGAVNLAVLRERLGFRATASDDYQTLAGLVMSLLDRLPVIGDRLEHADWRLHVTEVKDRRVVGVLLRRTADAER
jgi:CBS domain containing-hemolysin-like protein